MGADDGVTDETTGGPDPPCPTMPQEKEEEACSICLEPLIEVCVLPRCHHACLYVSCTDASCFPCITTWVQTAQNEPCCPLCKQPIGSYVMYRADMAWELCPIKDLQAPPVPTPTDAATELDALPSSPRQLIQFHQHREDRIAALRRREEARLRRRQRQALAFRRHIYRHGLYAKHVASNRYTRYRPYPGPAGFRKNPAHARLLITFLQRELQVWPYLDAAFLTFYIPAMLAHADITSDAVLRSVTEWIGVESEARHLLHEIELFVRSGRGSLGLDQYDSNPWLQYDHVD